MPGSGALVLPGRRRWGWADAQFNLAVLYERGDGVPQSLPDALQNGMPSPARAATTGAQQRAGVLANQLSEADRTAAQKSAQAFKAQPLSRHRECARLNRRTSQAINPCKI